METRSSKRRKTDAGVAASADDAVSATGAADDIAKAAIIEWRRFCKINPAEPAFLEEDKTNFSNPQIMLQISNERLHDFFIRAAASSGRSFTDEEKFDSAQSRMVRAGVHHYMCGYINALKRQDESKPQDDPSRMTSERFYKTMQQIFSRMDNPMPHLVLSKALYAKTYDETKVANIRIKEEPETDYGAAAARPSEPSGGMATGGATDDDAAYGDTHYLLDFLQERDTHRRSEPSAAMPIGDATRGRSGSPAAAAQLAREAETENAGRSAE